MNNGVDESGVTGGIDQICSAIEAFFAALQHEPRLEGRPEPLPPQSAEAIDALEEQFSLRLPVDVRAFLRRGLKNWEFYHDEPFGHIGFSFGDVASIASWTTMYRDIAQDIRDPGRVDDYEENYMRVLTHGIFLTATEPALAVMASGPDMGTVYHFSTRNEAIPVTGSFTTFLEHWLAAGCHSSHNFTAMWPIVRDLVPAQPSPEDNLWLQYYGRLFGLDL